MSSNVTYRKMVSDDVPAVYEIELASFPVAWTLDSFYYEVHENPYAHYVLAEDADGSIIGFCGMWMVIDANFKLRM